MSLSITTTVTGTTVVSARKLVEEAMAVSAAGIALIMVTDVKIEPETVAFEIVGEEIHVTYPEGATGTATVSFEAVLV